MKTTTRGEFAQIAKNALILGGCLLAAAALSSCSSGELGPAAVQPVIVYEPDMNRTALHGGGEPAGGEGLVDPAAMLAAHNRWRAQAGVPDLAWSDKLAAVSQGWADHLQGNGCTMVHSRNGYGENLYWASPLMWSDGRREFKAKGVREVVDSWGSEMKDYNYADNTCSAVCGHYTQLVWRDTKQVGCAMAVCADKGQIWVCTYHPAGNFVGKRPY